MGGGECQWGGFPQQPDSHLRSPAQRNADGPFANPCGESATSFAVLRTNNRS